jgi:replication initiation protein RepC
MTDNLATTPFGGAGVFARHFVRRRRVAHQQAELAERDAGNRVGHVDKWQVLRALTETKGAYALSDRSIAVLEALLSFHPEREIEGASPLIVFPSNQQLSLRCRGMSPATIRRHLAALVEAGLIFRKDSPNGKRYCRRDSQGEPEAMFGFDLAPFALAAPAICQQAETVRAEERLRQSLRCEITLHLRDIAKMLQAAFNETRAGDWTGLGARLDALSGRVVRNAAIADLTMRRDGLLRLRADLEKAYLEAVTAEEMSASACQYEHHIQIPKIDQTEESAQKARTGAAGNGVAGEKTTRSEEPDGLPGRGGERQTSEQISLSRVVAACPQIADYSRGGIRSRIDLLSAAALVRPMLRISPSAWQRACRAMGEAQAAIAVAAILERSDHIRSAGSYLKTLATKAETGSFSVLPMLQALEYRTARGASPHHV